MGKSAADFFNKFRDGALVARGNEGLKVFVVFVIGKELHFLCPTVPRGGDFGGIGGFVALFFEGGIQRLQAQFRIGNQLDGAEFVRVKAGSIDGQDFRICTEQGF